MRVLVVEVDDAIAAPLHVARVATGAAALAAPQGPNSSGHSGLGLAIVRQLAARNDASAELRQADPAGLNAVITLSAVEGRP